MSVPIKWTASVQGVGGVFTAIDAVAKQAYACDGWGVSYSGTRLRRFDLNSGVPGPTALPKDDVSSFLSNASGLGLLAATSHRIIELDRTDLTLRRQWRSPRYATQNMLWWHERLVLANWMAPTVVLFDPSNGSSRRVNVGQFPLVVETELGLVLGSGETGAIRLLRSPDARPELLFHAPPFRSMAYDAQHSAIWLAHGRRANVTSESVDNGAPSAMLGAYSLRTDATSNHPTTAAVWDIAVFAGELWARVAGRRGHVPASVGIIRYALPALVPRERLLIPEPFDVTVIAPAARSALAIDLTPTRTATQIACLALESPGSAN